jgi:hypothetical protein
MDNRINGVMAVEVTFIWLLHPWFLQLKQKCSTEGRIPTFAGESLFLFHLSDFQD